MTGGIVTDRSIDKFLREVVEINRLMLDRERKLIQTVKDRRCKMVPRREMETIHIRGKQDEATAAIDKCLR